ncbi:MAG: PH domain-containing protein [Limnochordia bacterium]
MHVADLANIMEWTFVSETTVPKEVQEILVPGEEAHAAYKTIRDVAVITNKRIIISDKQGITGKKVEVYTIPFKSIVMYSSENAGLLDVNAELELWTRVGKFKLNLKRGVDIRKLDRLIGQAIL